MAINWTTLTNSGSRAWVGLSSSTNGQYVFGVVSSGYIYRSTDGGATFGTVNSSTTWIDLCCSDSGQYVYALSSGGIQKSSDYGASWSAVTSQPTFGNFSIACSSDGQYVYALSNGYIYRYSNYSLIYSGTTNIGISMYIAVSSNGAKIIGAPVGNYLRISTDYGANFNSISPGAGNGYFSGVCCTDDFTKIVVSRSSFYIFYSTDSGATFTASTEYAQRIKVDVSNDGSVLIDTDGSYVYISSNLGITSTQQTSLGNVGANLCRISPDGKIMYVASSSGYIYKGTTVVPNTSGFFQFF